MRIMLVGGRADRDRLRAGLDEAGIEIVGEAPSLAAAQDSGLLADAFLVAAPPSGGDARRAETAGTLVEDEGDMVEPLTPRELDVLALVAEGLPNKAIARQLGISDQTVKFHIASITGKLGASNRTEAVRRAVRRGLVTL